MVERQRGLLNRIWHPKGRLTPGVLADVLLMVSLADGRLSPAKTDALSWALAHRPELAGLSWSQLLERAEVLAEDAPLFFDLRQALAEALEDPKDRRLALALASRIAGADGALEEEEQALLRSVAQSFHIGETEQSELLRSLPPGSPVFRWRRTTYTNPAVAPIPFFEALAGAKEPGEVRILVHRLHAIRALLDTRFRGATIAEIGPSVGVDGGRIQLDAILELEEHAVWVRTLAAGESLYPTESALLPRLLESVPADVRFCVSHAGPLSPPDALLFDGLPAIEVVSITTA